MPAIEYQLAFNKSSIQVITESEFKIQLGERMFEGTIEHVYDPVDDTYTSTVDWHDDPLENGFLLDGNFKKTKKLIETLEELLGQEFNDYIWNDYAYPEVATTTEKGK